MPTERQAEIDRLQEAWARVRLVRGAMLEILRNAETHGIDFAEVAGLVAAERVQLDALVSLMDGKDCAA